jgi:hypothetical protein
MTKKLLRQIVDIPFMEMKIEHLLKDFESGKIGEPSVIFHILNTEVEA